MKNKTKNILCKKTKKLATNYESSTIMLNSIHYLKKTFFTTSVEASTNPNHCLSIKVKTKNEKNRKKVRD